MIRLVNNLKRVMVFTRVIEYSCTNGSVEMFALDVLKHRCPTLIGYCNDAYACMHMGYAYVSVYTCTLMSDGHETMTATRSTRSSNRGDAPVMGRHGTTRDIVDDHDHDHGQHEQRHIRSPVLSLSATSMIVTCSITLFASGSNAIPINDSSRANLGQIRRQTRLGTPGRQRPAASP